MAVRVVLDQPPAGGGARLLRGLGFLLGCLLVLVAVVAGMWPLLYVIITVDSIFGDSTVDHGWDSLQPLLIALAITIVAMWLGLRLIRWRRRLGLYLRKFGYGDATRVVTGALTSAVGRHVRLATLDDVMVAPVGVDRARRMIAAFVFFVSTGLAAWGLYWAFGGGYDRAMAAADEIEDISDSFGAGLGLIIQLVIVLIGVSLALSIALLAGSAYRAARRADRLSRQAIQFEHMVLPTTVAIAKLSRKILSPRLFVVRVVAQLWTQAVYALGAAAQVVIIDVSHPTDALLWEVETMKRMFGGRWILVGAYEHVAPLADARTAAGGDHRARLAQLLEGEEVIAYGHTAADHKRFARALRNRLHRKDAERTAAPAPAPVR